MSKHISLTVPLFDGRLPTDINNAINVDLLGSGIYSTASSVDSQNDTSVLVYAQVELENNNVGDDVQGRAQMFIDSAHRDRLKRAGIRVPAPVTKTVVNNVVTESPLKALKEVKSKVPTKVTHESEAE